MLTVNRYIFNSVSVQEETHRTLDITYLSCLEHTTTTAAAPVAAAAVETRQSEKKEEIKIKKKRNQIRDNTSK